MKRKNNLKRIIDKKMSLQTPPNNINDNQKNRTDQRNAARIYGHKITPQSSILSPVQGKNKKSLKDYSLEYNRNNFKTLSILIVNYNNLDYSKKCVDDLLKQININFNVWFIDQNSNELGTEEYLDYLKTVSKITVLKNNKNLDLNRVWNFFYTNCDSDYLCFLNNDVSLTNNFVDDTIKILDTNENVGAVIHTTNNPNFVKADHTLNYEILTPPLYQGWDFTIRRNLFELIPESLRIFGGDDITFSHIIKKGYKIALSYSSPIIHYKEKTREKIGNEIINIQKSDSKNYWIEINKHNLQHIDSTFNTNKSNKYPPKNIKLIQNKKCIFTASIGDYDQIGGSKVGKLKDWDYICFTDNKDLKSDFWKVIYIPNSGTTILDNYKLARKIKTTFYKRLSSYDILIWKDTRMIINSDLNKYAENLNGNDMIFMNHNETKSISQEFDRVLSGKLETKEMIEQIKKHYNKNGYNYKNGLIASGVLLFRNNKKTVKFFSEWWSEIEKYSYRDQLSANYVLSRNKELIYKTLPFHSVLSNNGVFNRGNRQTKRLTF